MKSNAPHGVEATKHTAAQIDHMHLEIQCVEVEMAELACDARVRQANWLEVPGEIEGPRKIDEAAAFAATIIEQNGQRHDSSSIPHRRKRELLEDIGQSALREVGHAIYFVNKYRGPFQATFSGEHSYPSTFVQPFGQESAQVRNSD
jgi:hypothetical protein